MKVTHWFKEQHRMLKTDTIMCLSFYIHILLTLFHLAYALFGNGAELRLGINKEWHFYARAGFCLLIAVNTFFFHRKGFSVTLVLYACVLLYINSFYNYTSFLFILFAVHAVPTMRNFTLVLYALNGFAAFALHEYGILAVGIHALNCYLYFLLSKHLLSSKSPDKLILTDSEDAILKELADGKMQKEIDMFSQTTITKKLRDAKERNLCKSTNDLIRRYMNEKEIKQEE